jgi:hypothetical protein
MNRRQALKSIGAAAALPLASSELFALGRTAHAHVQQSETRDRYVFQSLDTAESEIVSAATELIIPETDTPGARSARVPEFIDTVLTGWFHEDERRRFLRGIRDLDDRARGADGAGFASCAAAAQIRILKELEAEALRALEDVEPTRLARRAAQSAPGAPFFSVLKWLTVFGYYTSEVGMNKELEFVEFPGSYDGCAPLQGPGAR